MKYVSLFILLLGFLPGYAQEFGSNTNSVPASKETSVNNTQDFKPDIRVSLGTSFSNFGSGYNSFGTFIAPEINMPVTHKLSIQLGLGYSSLLYGYGGESLFGTNPSQYGSLYVSGTYRVNEKLIIRGTGYKTFLLNPAPSGETTNTAGMDFSNQGAIFDIGYKVSDHFQINASFEYRQQNYPVYYYGSPQNGFGSPNSLNRGFGSFGGFGPGF